MKFPDDLKLKRLMVRLPEDLHRAAMIKAAREGRPVAEVIREAIRRWVRGEDDFCLPEEDEGSSSAL